MGGLVARQYMITKMNNSKVRVLITIASPNTGASIADPKHWLPFLAFDGLVIITPVLVDTYVQKPKITASISSPVMTIGKWLVNFMKKFVKVPPKTIEWSLNKIFASIWNFLNLTFFYPSVKEMTPGSAFLKKLNNKILPSTGNQGKPIWYASIYGSDNKFFDLAGSGVKDAFSTISTVYALNGGYYILEGGWWNWELTAQGLAYITCAALLTQPVQQSMWNIVIGSSKSDAVVPISSQMLQRKWVSNSA